MSYIYKTQKWFLFLNLYNLLFISSLVIYTTSKSDILIVSMYFLGSRCNWISMYHSSLCYIVFLLLCWKVIVELIWMWLFCSIKTLFDPVCIFVALEISWLILLCWPILQWFLFTTSIYSNCLLNLFVIARFFLLRFCALVIFYEGYVKLMIIFVCLLVNH